MDKRNFEEDQIHNYLYGVTKEVIVGALYHGMVIMLGSQCVISYYDPNVFLKKDSFSKHN